MKQVNFCVLCSIILLYKFCTFTYRPLYCPSTFSTVPSPETTATRSLPLNHFTECSSPHDFTSMGHVNTTDWPRSVETVSSENEKNIIIRLYFMTYLTDNLRIWNYRKKRALYNNSCRYISMITHLFIYNNYVLDPIYKKYP